MTSSTAMNSGKNVGNTVNSQGSYFEGDKL